MKVKNQNAENGADQSNYALYSNYAYQYSYHYIIRHACQYSAPDWLDCRNLDTFKLLYI